MATDEEIHNALLAINSKLGTIEGKLNLVARAERERLLGVLEEAFKKDPTLAQIYLLLDGSRSQVEILEGLNSAGIGISQPTVSRKMTLLAEELGVADGVVRGGTLVLRKNGAAEAVLNLSRHASRWLGEKGSINPLDVPKGKPMS